MDFFFKEPGEDYDWTIGTELRQQRMHEEAVISPDTFRDVLIDDVKRRHYILDADVKEHTMALASIGPTTNHEGYSKIN